MAQATLVHSFFRGACNRFANMFALAVLVVVSGSLAHAKDGDKPIAIAEVKHDGPVSFEKEILPLFAKNCLACHNATTHESGLVLETAAAILKGGDSGPAVEPKKSATSLLLKVAAHLDDPAMPPADNKVSAVAFKSNELGLIKLWIDQGAVGDVAAAAGPVKWQSLPAGINPIYAASITSDGQYAACSRANQIFVYHLPSGRLVTRLTDPGLVKSGLYKNVGVAHLDLVQSLAFNPNGNLLASGAFREVKLWQRPDSTRKADLAGLAAAAQAIAVSPDGKLAVTGDAAGAIQVWNPTTGQRVALANPQAFIGHSGAITSLRFLPASDKLVSGSLDKSLRVWNVTDGLQLNRIDTPVAISALAVIGDGTSLATGGDDKLVRIWNTPASAARTLADIPGPITSLSASPDKKSLALAGPDGAISIVDVASGKPTRTLAGRKVAVVALSYTADGNRLAAGEADGAVRVWDVAKGEVIAKLQASLAPLTALAIQPAGNQLVTGSSDGRVGIFKLDVAAAVALQPALDAAASAAAVSFDGKQLALGTTSGGKPAIVVRDLASGAISKTLVGHEGPITTLAFTSDGAKLVSGSADKTARAWNLADGKELAKFALAQPITAVAMNAGGTLAAAAAADNSLKTWNTADGAEAKNFAGLAGPASSLAFSSNGQSLISGAADMTVRQWNVADGAQAKSYPQAGPVVAMALSRDDAKLAVALADGNVKLVQLADGKDLLVLGGNKTPAKNVSFSADGKQVVAAAGNMAIVWDVATGALVEIAPAESGAAFALLTATPGELIVGGADKSTVKQLLHFERAAPGLTKAVTQLRYKPDGSVFYAASEDGTLRGFQPANGQQTFSANHASPIRSLAVSGDGKLLATGGDDMLVKVWSDAGAPAAKPQLAGLTGPVTSAAFSADGTKIIASGASAPASADKPAGPQVVVFNVVTGTADQFYSEHAAPVLAVAAVPEGEKGTLVVSASADKAVRLWSVAAGMQLAGHTGPITAIAYLPADKSLLSGGENIRQWNLQNGQAIRQIDHGGAVTALAVRGDGLQIASAGANNLVKLWKPDGQVWAAPNNQPIAPMIGDYRAQLRSAALDRKIAATTAKIADAKKTTMEAEAKVTATAEAIKTANTAKETAAKLLVDKTAAAKAPVEAKATAEKELEVATANAKAAMEKATAAKDAAEKDKNNVDLAKTNGEAAKASEETEKKRKEAEKKLADATPPATKATQEATSAEAGSMAAEQAAAAAVVANTKAIEAVPVAQALVKAAEAALTQAQADSTVAKKSVTDMEKPVRTLAYSADGAQLASGGDNGLVRTWSTDTGAPADTYAGHAGPVVALAFAADGNVISSAADKSAIVWDAAPAWTLVRTIGDADKPAILVDRVLSMSFSPDGKTLATGGGEPSRSGELKLWNVADGSLAKAIADAHSDTIFGLDFSPDGAYLASSAADRFVKVFDVAKGTLVKSFEGHTHHVLDVAWRGDGKILASCGADNVIKVWDFITGDQKLTSQPFGKEITSLAFVAETQKMLVSSGDKTVRLVNTENGNSERNFAGAGDFMYCTAVTPDGKLGIGGGQESVLIVWNIENGQQVRTFEAPKTASDKAASDRAASDRAEAGKKETAKK